jgi:hypothetical protein
MARGGPGFPEATDASGQPLTNTALVEAMQNVSVADTAETRALLFRLLLETSLLAVTLDRPDSPRAFSQQVPDRQCIAAVSPPMISS